MVLFLYHWQVRFTIYMLIKRKKNIQVAYYLSTAHMFLCACSCIRFLIQPLRLVTWFIVSIIWEQYCAEWLKVWFDMVFFLFNSVFVVHLCTYAWMMMQFGWEGRFSKGHSSLHSLVYLCRLFLFSDWSDDSFMWRDHRNMLFEWFIYFWILLDVDLNDCTRQVHVDWRWKLISLVYFWMRYIRKEQIRHFHLCSCCYVCG